MSIIRLGKPVEDYFSVTHFSPGISNKLVSPVQLISSFWKEISKEYPYCSKLFRIYEKSITWLGYWQEGENKQRWEERYIQVAGWKTYWRRPLWAHLQSGAPESLASSHKANDRADSILMKTTDKHDRQHFCIKEMLLCKTTKHAKSAHLNSLDSSFAEVPLHLDIYLHVANKAGDTRRKMSQWCLRKSIMQGWFRKTTFTWCTDLAGLVLCHSLCVPWSLQPSWPEAQRISLDDGNGAQYLYELVRYQWRDLVTHVHFCEA